MSGTAIGGLATSASARTNDCQTNPASCTITTAPPVVVPHPGDSPDLPISDVPHPGDSPDLPISDEPHGDNPSDDPDLPVADKPKTDKPAGDQTPNSPRPTRTVRWSPAAANGPGGQVTATAS